MTAVEGTRFVLIDARSDVLELWEELLRDTVGLEANVECFDHAPAVDRLAAADPDYVLMGLTLGGDGEALDLWRAMRSHPVLFDVPVLACSGDLDAAASQRAEFLAKPFTLDDFDRAIQRLLAVGRSERSLPVRDAPASPTDLSTA